MINFTSKADPARVNEWRAERDAGGHGAVPGSSARSSRPARMAGAAAPPAGSAGQCVRRHGDGCHRWNKRERRRGDTKPGCPAARLAVCIHVLQRFSLDRLGFAKGGNQNLNRSNLSPVPALKHCKGSALQCLKLSYS